MEQVGGHDGGDGDPLRLGPEAEPALLPMDLPQRLAGPPLEGGGLGPRLPGRPAAHRQGGLAEPGPQPGAGPELAGHQRSAQFEGPVSGSLSGGLIQLAFASHYEASTICYFFDGELRDGKMSGTAVLGAASDQNHGIVNRSQFGSGRWQASRVA